MKSISLILATFICLLTVEPVAIQIYSSVTHKKDTCTMACCKRMMDKKHTKNNCCTNGICNPFGMCNCCFVYSASEMNITFGNTFSNSKIERKEENNVVSSYLSDCFHPPELS